MPADAGNLLEDPAKAGAAAGGAGAGGDKGAADKAAADAKAASDAKAAADKTAADAAVKAEADKKAGGAGEQTPEQKQAAEKAAADAKAASDKAAGDAKAKAEADAKAREFAATDLKLPEKSPLDAEDVKAVAELAKKHGLTKDAAQAMLEREHQVATEFVSAQAEEWQGTLKAYDDALAKHPELGGEKLAATMVQARKGLAATADPALTKLLQDTGLFRSPLVVAHFHKIGAMLAEDKIINGNQGGTPDTKPLTLEQGLYGPKKA
jgi:hypothetical protein